MLLLEMGEVWLWLIVGLGASSPELVAPCTKKERTDE